MRERHYLRDRLVLRVSRLRVLHVYVYCPFVVYTCLQSTSPYTLPTPLRFTIATSPHESLRVARRLSITSFELPRYTTLTTFFTAERKAELLRVIWARSKGRGMQSALASTDQRRVRYGMMSNCFIVLQFSTRAGRRLQTSYLIFVMLLKRKYMNFAFGKVRTRTAMKFSGEDFE